MVTRDPKTCGNHASIIIGKKKIGGKCHYLVRNTWGKDCSKYDWKCDTLEMVKGWVFGLKKKLYSIIF